MRKIIGTMLAALVALASAGSALALDIGYDCAEGADEDLVVTETTEPAPKPDA